MLKRLRSAGIHVADQQRAHIQATHAGLDARGVRFTAEPHVAPWGNRWATFCDADGNEYGLSLESEGQS